MAKLTLVFVAVFLLCQFVTWGTATPREKREEPTTEKNPLADIEATLTKAKEYLSNVASDVQGSDFFQNVTQSLQALGAKVKEASKKLVDNIQGTDDKPAVAT